MLQGRALAAEPIQIPLVHVKTDYAGDGYDALGILVGINGGKPHLFEFDTGSDEFNMQLSGDIKGVDPVPGSKPALYAYGDGSYGYWVQQVQLNSLSYFHPADLSEPAATIDGEYVGGRILDRVYTHKYDGFASLNTAKKPINGTDDTPLFADLDVRQRIQNGQPGETPPFFGIFGAGDYIGEEIKTSALGGSTQSGYVVSGNANMGDGKTPGCAPCLTLNLTPSIRAQFTALTAWGTMDYVGNRRHFPQSGANASTEFEGIYNYTISIDVGKKKRAVDFKGPLLFDTGADYFLFLPQDKVLKKLSAKGLKLKQDTSATVDFKISGSGDTLNDLESDDVDIYRLADEYEGDAIIVGLPFFQVNSVLFDLENKTTAYSPLFVTTTNFTTDAPSDGQPRLNKVTADMGSNGWLGIAGTLSGGGDLMVAKDAVVRLTASNTYAGATHIADGGFIYLAGPGDIKHSSTVIVDGVLDISQKGNHNIGWGVADSENIAEIRNLNGKGEVHVGARKLVVKAGNGRFDGSILDYDGESEGLGGGVVLASGRLELGGENGYTGLTEVAAGAQLIVSGSLPGDVRAFGELIIEGEVLGTVTVENGGNLTGTGKAGKVVVVEGRKSERIKTTNVD